SCSAWNLGTLAFLASASTHLPSAVPACSPVAVAVATAPVEPVTENLIATLVPGAAPFLPPQVLAAALTPSMPFLMSAVPSLGGKLASTGGFLSPPDLLPPPLHLGRLGSRRQSTSGSGAGLLPPVEPPELPPVLSDETFVDPPVVPVFFTVFLPDGLLPPESCSPASAAPSVSPA